jgi:hypothetical protein
MFMRSAPKDVQVVQNHLRVKTQKRMQAISPASFSEQVMQDCFGAEISANPAVMRKKFWFGTAK